MLTIDPAEVEAVVERVRARVGAGVPAKASPAARVAADRSWRASSDGDGVFATVDEAVEAAWTAFQRYTVLGLDRRYAVIDSIRQAMRANAGELARLAHEETGLGRAEDKVRKNLLVTNKTPGPEDLEPKVWTGDDGMTITEYAPYGVIASITPTTNPTSTIINNTISILSAGNALVFNVHPNAKRVSMTNVRLINQAIVAAGGPPNLVTAVEEPTIETAQVLMNHPRVRLLLVTGGPGVVREALKTNKKAITAGPGNPPVVVDETAELAAAGRDIVRGASFDNNVICTDEKEVFVVEAVADELVRAMSRHDAVVLKEYQVRQLERLIFSEPGLPGKPGKINPRWIGQDAGRILAEIGAPMAEDVRLLVAEVPLEHCLVWTEQMMPVLPVVRVRHVDEAIERAVEAEHRFGHTASIYSRNVDAITRMARAINVSIFVANAPNFAGLGEGGEGFTSYSIASPTGEGMTRARTFARVRRVTVAGALRIV